MRRAFRCLSTNLILVAAAAVSLLCGHTPPAAAQQKQGGEEIVANLATGRVVFCVSRDGIIVGAVTNDKAEPGSHAPLFVPLVGGHVAVLLGAVEWVEVNSNKPPVRLDQLLADLPFKAMRSTVYSEANEAGDIEGLGMRFLEAFRPVAGLLHHQVNIKEDEPLVQILVIGYEQDYGPEAWLLNYLVQQRELEDNYFDTLVLRPSYTQLYPPEKGEPRTIVEHRYPADMPGPTLAELLGRNDSRLISIRQESPVTGKAAQFVLDGASQKAASEGVTAFIRGALTATSPPDSKLTLAILREGDRFDWIVPPTDMPKKPTEKRADDAPTLRGPHHQ
jgi:hypothetical protein